MASPGVTPQWVASRATAMGLPTNAVMRVANQEGLSGAIGDGGHAFGPFQMNNAGGVLTGKFPGRTPQQINQWAWSPKGVNYALAGIQKNIGQGNTGNAAIHDIVYNFERPTDKEGEYARAIAQGWQGGSAGGASPAPTPTSIPKDPLALPPVTQPNQSRISKFLIQQGTNMLQGKDFNTAALMQAFKPQAAPAQSFTPPTPGLAKTQRVLSSAATDAPNGSIGQQLVETARTQLGNPYQWGGPAELGKNTDCSGLIQATYAAHGINIPRTTYDQWTAGKNVPLDQMQPGDAIYFHMGPKGPEHVGMFVGDGKMIEDPHTGDVVKIQSLSGYDAPVGARRFSNG